MRLLGTGHNGERVSVSKGGVSGAMNMVAGSSWHTCVGGVPLSHLRGTPVLVVSPSACVRCARTREPGKRRSGRLSAPVAGTSNNGRAAVRRAPDTPTTACTPQET
eukprot:scaffold23154_cov67-Phaeocystis_antarctica.AAC.6